MVAKCLFLILISVVYVSSSLNVTFLKSYDEKTCKNEPSCDLVNEPDLTDERRTLRARPCMCDSKCVIYRDCCTDSKYYNELEQRRPPPFHCQTTYKVYMKTTCPETWTDEAVKSNCILSTSAPRSEDTSLIVPVTNKLTNITYGNQYCAHCHGITNFTPWTLSPLCGEAPAGLLLENATSFLKSTTALPSVPEVLPVSSSIPPTPLTLVSSPIPSSPAALTKRSQKPPLAGYSISSPTSKVIFRRGRSLEFLSAEEIHQLVDSGFANVFSKNRRKRAAKVVVNFYKYYKHLNEIWKLARYDSHSGYFVSRYSEKDMICAVFTKLQTDLKPHTRACVPNTIETCQETTDPDTVKQCQSYTSHIFNARNNKAYRNKDCATCDGADTTYLTGCPIIPRDST